jgi:LPS O-antigen subunit length determinant protein (WzzB/FepE family)
MDPSNFDDELLKLKKVITRRLNEASQRIISEEIQNILGRVKIIRQADLKSMNYEWFITPEEKS